MYYKNKILFYLNLLKIDSTTEAKEEDTLNTEDLVVIGNTNLSDTVYDKTNEENIEEWSSENKDCNVVTKIEGIVEKIIQIFIICLHKLYIHYRWNRIISGTNK